MLPAWDAYLGSRPEPRRGAARAPRRAQRVAGRAAARAQSVGDEPRPGSPARARARSPVRTNTNGPRADGARRGDGRRRAVVPGGARDDVLCTAAVRSE